MESKDKLKEIDTKNCTCSLREKCSYSELFWSAFSFIRTEYGEIRMRENAHQNNSELGNFLRSGCYFDDKMKDADINFSHILLDEKLYENISVYNVSYKASTGTKPLRIRFDKNLIRVC